MLRHSASGLEIRETGVELLAVVGGSGHAPALGEAAKAEFRCSRRCEAVPGDLDGSQCLPYVLL